MNDATPSSSDPRTEAGERPTSSPPRSADAGGDAPTAAPQDSDAEAEAPAGEADTGDGTEDVEGAAGGGLDLESIAEADPRSKAELIGAVLDLEAARDEYLDDLRRARAEFENYRRRVAREAATQRAAGAAEAVTAMLEVLDDLDRTLEAAETSSDEGLAKGVQLVASKLTHALQGLGVERLEATDVPFDPTHHEAVQQLPAEEPTDTPIVAQVLRPGYRLEDRVLRAAMVVVQG